MMQDVGCRMLGVGCWVHGSEWYRGDKLRSGAEKATCAMFSRKFFKEIDFGIISYLEKWVNCG